MASNHTTNYKLNQWESTDKVERLDFNADNEALEAALTNHDTQIAAANTRISVVRSDMTTELEELQTDLEGQVAQATSAANTKIAALETSTNTKISSAQSTLNSKITSLQTSLNTTNTNVSNCYSPSNLPFLVGSYTGNSSNVSSNSNTQDITIGFTPRFVLIHQAGDNDNFAAATAETTYYYSTTSYVNLQVITNGFRVGAPRTSSTVVGPQLNTNGKTYIYVALK